MALWTEHEDLGQQLGLGVGTRGGGTHAGIGNEVGCVCVREKAFRAGADGSLLGQQPDLGFRKQGP